MASNLGFSDVSEPSVRSIFKGWMKNGVRLSFADVSEPYVRSIFEGWMKNGVKFRVFRRFGTLCRVDLQRLDEEWRQI
jgi:hypothetical protein